MLLLTSLLPIAARGPQERSASTTCPVCPRARRAVIARWAGQPLEPCAAIGASMLSGIVERGSSVAWSVMWCVSSRVVSGERALMSVRTVLGRRRACLQAPIRLELAESSSRSAGGSVLITSSRREKQSVITEGPATARSASAQVARDRWSAWLSNELVHQVRLERCRRVSCSSCP